MSLDLSSLNPEQRKAVEHTEGPCIILAGAGSGKTKVLTYRTAYIIDKGVNPTNIFLTTFTNKAANEMKERIHGLLNTTESPTVGTFHSFCAKVLRIEGKYIGLSPRYAIFDEADQQDLVKVAIQELGLSIKEVKPGAVLGTISQAKNELITPEQYKLLAHGAFQEIVAKVYPRYQTLLSENDAVDFDDLMFNTVTLFMKNPDILTKYQNRYRYILIDEYQDTNHAQYMLTKLLASKYKNICVVGDFSQSIYSWRGADFQNLEKFQSDFVGTRVFSLSQNYRSTQNILDAASSVIKRNGTHPVLSLWTTNPKGEQVFLYEARTEQEEIEFIINQIVTMTIASKDENNPFQLSNVAILYRTNAQSRIIEEVLLHHSIPYVLVGGTRFYDRKEIKDVLSYLRVIANPKDTVSKKRIEKLGKNRYLRFISFTQSLNNLEEKETIELLDQVLKATDYLSLYDEKDEEDSARLENIKELRSVAISFPHISQFLENVALVEQEYMPDRFAIGDKKNAITLMTMHAAKGLEFPVIFMVGMEEGLFPHNRSLFDRYALEEERRLCYVGMTRAKERLFLSYAQRRLLFGQRSTTTLSRFILELPESVLSSHMHIIQTNKDDTPDFL